jgi:transposase
VDTIGLLLTVLVTAAGVQDRDGARPLLWNLRQAFRTVRQAWADSGYAGKLVTWAKTRLRLKLQIVRRTELHKFLVLPRRWVVERTFASRSAATCEPFNLSRSSRVALAAGIRCATDVTGFGLLGHLFKLARVSGVSAVVDHAAVPLIDGTRAAARAGHMPGGSRRNLRWVLPHTDAGTVGEDDLLLIADAQTSGGCSWPGSCPERQ